MAKAPKLSPMETTDAEDELGDWLDDHGIAGGWELAPTLVAGRARRGVAGAGRSGCARTTPPSRAVRWLAYTVETETLMNEIEDATTRISTLVGAAKQYSQMDRAPFQVVDVHELLDRTLVMLGRKLGAGIRWSRTTTAALPPIPAYAAELNQVWTNLIDNAVARDGRRRAR